MYLSRMFLNPRRHGTRELLGSPQKMHAAVQSAFPPDALADGRVLWRIDREEERLSLYVVSPTQPSFEHLQEQAGWSAQKSWDMRPYDPVLDRLMKGQEYGFRLTANPVRIVTDAGGKKKRVPHVTVDQQLSWLLDRQAQMGVEFPRHSGVHGGGEPAPFASVTGRESIRFARGSGTVTLSRAQFDGVLRVADVNALRSTLIEGIGKAKAYGCGLMTLAPVTSNVVS